MNIRRLSLSTAFVAISTLLAGAGSITSSSAVAQPDPVPAPAPAVKPATPTTAAMPNLSERQKNVLRQLLDKAGEQGLRPPTGGAAALNDQALVQQALDYAAAMHGQRLRSEDFLRDWGLHPLPFDPRPSFITAVNTDRLDEWAGTLAPPYAGYDALRQGLAYYRKVAANGGWPQIPAGPDLAMGATGERVDALRRRLAAENGVTPKGLGQPYDAALADEVREAQKRFGIERTGTVGKQTLAALNVPVNTRIRQIVANMERWRWLPYKLPAERIQVNTAAAVLTYFREDRPVMSMRVVTGRPGHETPILQSQIHSIVLNPPWNVPTSIANKEIWPKARAHPGYLKRAGFRVISTSGGKRLQQVAGPKSALGRVKFDFDNPYGVYLHDTPAKAVFDRYGRLASHGCVRMEKPVLLTDQLLRNNPEWTRQTVEAKIQTTDTERVQLGTPVNVLLLYWTAYGSGNGPLSFRNDPYGWDELLAKKLDAAAGRTIITMGASS